MTLSLKAQQTTSQCVRICLALSLQLISSWLLNTTIFAAYGFVAPWTRDLSMVLLVAAGLAVTIAAIRRPDLFVERVMTPLFLSVFALGVAVSLLGIVAGSPALMTIGSLARSVGYLWPFVMLGMVLAKLDARVAAVVISCAFVLKYVWLAAASLVPLEEKTLLYGMLPFVIVALVRKYAADLFEVLSKSESQADLQVTSPSSFLPFTHTLFVTIAVFNAASGFSLSFGAVASMPQEPLFSFVPLVVVTLLVVYCGRIAVDKLFHAATLLVLAGLLWILTPSAGILDGIVPWTQVFLTAGSDCFSLLIWFVITRLAARNVLGALPMLSFLHVAQMTGTVAGAGVGHLTNAAFDLHPSWATVLVLTTVLLFVAYNLVALKPFSFEATLTQVTPIQSVFIAAAPATLEENCKKVVHDYGLTPREAEIVELLARGRNSQAIQEKLVVSRNTVKTHVKNIYLKLDVHSQQELIDLVERV